MPVSISVITPTLNAAGFLSACLENVGAQQHAHVEHIVVDGGSTDGTIALVDSRPEIVLLQRPGFNQSQAINEGFRAAHGEVLAWLNADDAYSLGALRLVADQFAAYPELDILYGDCDVVDAFDKLLWREIPGAYDYYRLLRRGNYIPQPAVFMRRRVIDRVGYLDESFECGMDYEYWLRVRNCHIQYVSQVLAIFRWHPNSKTAQGQLSCWRELLRVVRRYGGGLTPPLVWSFARMLFTLSRQRAWRAFTN